MDSLEIWLVPTGALVVMMLYYKDPTFQILSIYAHIHRFSFLLSPTGARYVIIVSQDTYNFFSSDFQHLCQYRWFSFLLTITMPLLDWCWLMLIDFADADADFLGSIKDLEFQSRLFWNVQRDDWSYKYPLDDWWRKINSMQSPRQFSTALTINRIECNPIIRICRQH